MSSTTPRTPHKLIFQIIKTTTPTECFFCELEIIPENDINYFAGFIPGKKTVMEIHPDCFEQLAWTMWQFLAHTLTHPETEVIN